MKKRASSWLNQPQLRRQEISVHKPGKTKRRSWWIDKAQVPQFSTLCTTNYQVLHLPWFHQALATSWWTISTFSLPFIEVEWSILFNSNQTLLVSDCVSIVGRLQLLCWVMASITSPLLRSMRAKLAMNLQSWKLFISLTSSSSRLFALFKKFPPQMNHANPWWFVNHQFGFH